MRNGQKPRQEHDAETVGDLAAVPETEAHNLKDLRPVPADDGLPAYDGVPDYEGVPVDDRLGVQLGLDSLDEPAEVLIRVSREALEGEDDLVGEELDETDDPGRPEWPAEAAATGDAGGTAGAAQAAEAAEAAEAAAVVEAIEGTDATEAAELADNAVEADDAAEAADVADTAHATDAAEAPDAAELAEVVEVHEWPAEAPTEPPLVFAEGEPAEEAVDAQAPELQAPLEPYDAVEELPLDDPSLQIRLARIHLKTGALAMARAEFEALAARKQLDTPAHLDLAEARWRTGDLQGAGEAAAAYMADGGDEALGFVIAAEAASLANRHADARRHTQEALERHLIELDPVFAGIPRIAMWVSGTWATASAEATPAEPAAIGATVVAEASLEAVAVFIEPATAVPEEPEPAEPVESTAVPEEPEVAEPVESIAVPEEPEAAEPVESIAVPEEPESAEPVQPRADASMVEQTADAVEAGAEVAAGRACLEAGDPMMAALHFGVAIRLAPASARAVLDAIGDRQELPLQLVRGDALRLLGMEGDAGRAYLSVATALGVPKTPTPEPTESEPVPAAELAIEPATPSIEPATPSTEQATPSIEPATPAIEPAAQSTDPAPPAREPTPPAPEPAPPESEPPAGPSVEEPSSIRWD